MIEFFSYILFIIWLHWLALKIYRDLNPSLWICSNCKHEHLKIYTCFNLKIKTKFECCRNGFNQYRKEIGYTHDI